MPRTKKSASASDDPNKLQRQRAGIYRTADDRFEVRQADIGWFLVDSTATNEFGQELVRGPFPTLKGVQEELPGARRTTFTPLPTPKASKTAKAPKSAGKPKPPPASWIDKLPTGEAAATRRLIKALELEGLADADDLVKSARKSQQPMVATRLLERRLEAMVDDLPPADRDGGRRLAQRVVELLATDGTSVFEPLPGWSLVEVGPEPEPPNRRLVLRGAPKKR